MNDLKRFASSATWSLALLIGMTACAPSVSQQTQAAVPADALPLWEVTDGHGTVYLLGSIHMLRPGAYPLDDAIYAAFDESAVATFELNLDSAVAAAPQMLARGTYQDGRTLATVLPSELYAELSERLGGLGVPVQAVSGMKPWLIALTLTALTLQQAGYETAQGVDRHFFDRAQAADKRITSLETMDQQLDTFNGMSEAEQIAFLRATLDDLGESIDMIDEMTELWKRGDAEAIAGMMTESLEDQPNLKRRMLDDRNQAWVPQIEAMLRSGETSMVIVGMGHLIGEGSVIDLLLGRSHSVTRKAAAAAAR
ncbi:MAG: TraB/GumN family protein [Gemmatimonadetes bacterium]|nr:TraB/GumN family protein [Gemmatimonadota bacterium]